MNRNCLFIHLLFFFCLMPIAAEAKCIFKGDLDFMQNNFALELNFKEKEKLAVELNFLPDDKFILKSKLDHIQLLNSYLTTELISEGSVIKNNKGQVEGLNGEIKTNYSLLNFKPISEISGYFELTKSYINIFSLLWGNLRVSGKINFDNQPRLDLSVDVIDMDINELAELLGADLGNLSVSGLVNGKVKIDGLISSPQIKGQLRVANGNIDTLEYNEIVINIEGMYPLLKFIDSNIFEREGYVYALTGSFNVEELDNINSSSHKIKLTPLSNDDFSWQEWKLRRQKSYSQDGALELEYKLKEDQPFKMRLRDDEEILSLEHSVKF